MDALVGTDPLVRRVRAVVAAQVDHELVGHDLAHLDRVHGLCLRIAAREGGDPTVLGAAAYVHDLHRVVERTSGGWLAPEEAAADILAALDAAGAADGVAKRVLACVACTGKHSFSVTPLDVDVDAGLEGRILHDADSLDAMGAIGVARACMFGGALGEPLHDPGAPTRDRYRAGPTASVVHHFREKLLRLGDDMLTGTARALARRRHAYMADFLAQLLAEWDEATLPLAGADPG